MEETQEKGLILEYFVPIQSSAELNGDFIINGIAINETTTSNGHQFIGEELSKSAHTMIGVPLLKDHDNSIDSIVGKVMGAHWDENMRNIPFRAIVKDAKVKQLIKDGLLNTVSVGAHVNPSDIEEAEDGSIIPHNISFKELSVVAVPADSGATFSMALNNAYKLHSTKVDNSTSTERRDNMTEEEKQIESESPEAVEAPVEAPEEEEVKTEESAILAMLKKMDARMAKLEQSDADEAKAEEVPEEKEAEEEVEEEAEDEDEDEIEEKSNYAFSEGHNYIGIQRRSYVY